MSTYSAAKFSQEDRIATSAPEAAPRSQKAPSAFRTISEVADDLGVQQHVLRFWETKFSQVRPLKRGGGRRYYRPEDVALLKHIHHLLYTEGYTIKGVQKLLKGQGRSQIAAEREDGETAAPAPQKTAAKTAGGSLSPQHRTALEVTLAELKALRSMIAD